MTNNQSKPGVLMNPRSKTASMREVKILTLNHMDTWWHIGGEIPMLNDCIKYVFDLMWDEKHKLLADLTEKVEKLDCAGPSLMGKIIFQEEVLKILKAIRTEGSDTSKELTLPRDKVFHDHIEAHFKKEHPDWKVVCKICNRTYDDIVNEAKGGKVGYD